MEKSEKIVRKMYMDRRDMGRGKCATLISQKSCVIKNFFFTLIICLSFNDATLGGGSVSWVKLY